MARSEAKSDFAALWPEREAQVQQAYNERYQQYQQQVAAESAAWDEAEAKRIEWVKKTTGGRAGGNQPHRCGSADGLAIAVPNQLRLLPTKWAFRLPLCRTARD